MLFLSHLYKYFGLFPPKKSTATLLVKSLQGNLLLSATDPAGMAQYTRVKPFSVQLPYGTIDIYKEDQWKLQVYPI